MATRMQDNRNGCRRVAPVVLLSSCLLAACAGAAEFNIVDYGAHDIAVVGERYSTVSAEGGVNTIAMSLVSCAIFCGTFESSVPKLEIDDAIRTPPCLRCRGA